MQKLAFALASYLAVQLGLDEDRREVLSFGALAFIQNGSSALLTLLLALAVGIVPETVIAVATAAVLRHASGGAHLRTPLRCVLATAVVFLLCGFLGDLTSSLFNSWPGVLRVVLVVIVASLGLLGVLRYAPVQAETRPLRPAHRVRLRRQSIRLVIVLTVALTLGAAAAAWWTPPALAGFVLQMFTLTPAGQALAHSFDDWLTRLSRR